MSSRRLILAAVLLSIASLAAAAQADFVIPASASLNGALGSHWQSEVTLYNSSTQEMAVVLSFHTGAGQVTSKNLTLAPRTTTSLDNIVGTTFGQTSALGAIVIDVTNDALADKLVAFSRTYNLSTNGEFGQDVPAVASSDTVVKGYTAVVTGPSDATKVRLNFGLYAVSDSTIRWKLIRNDGSVAKEVEVDYKEGTHAQYSPGVVSLFELNGANNDVVQADVLDGNIVLYGSMVNNATGDPTFVPAGHTREAAPIEFVGVDLNEDGVVDITAHDGVLDRPVEIATSMFSNFFRVVAVEASGKPLTLTLINPSRDVALVDSDGTVQWTPGVDVKGSTGSLTVRATDGFHTSELLIPVKFY